MKVSLNWIKQYLDFELPPIDELVDRIGIQLGAVEEVVNLGEKYKGVLIVKVMACEKLDNSDHLNECLVDDGGTAQGIERNEEGFVQVLTGAPNVHAGMIAVWLPPGVTVPESVGDGKEPFVLESRNMRGAMSHGMLASPRELALGDLHEGILDLTDEKVTPTDMPLVPGADFAEVYGLNDYIIDIENKMFTHRPDCFGHLGVAREIAGIFGQKFKSPERYLQLTKLEAGSGLELQVTNEIPEKVPRFMAVAMKNITMKPSPFWLQVELYRVDAKPISNVVDVTNYVMLLTGQPFHAYDYDKVAARSSGPGAIMVVRYPREGEKISLLNGKTIALKDFDMMVATDKELICVGGAIGGADTEVDDTTKNIILEGANWDMYAIRRTSMAHGIFTDAVTRFNKGQSPLQNPHALQLAVGHMETLSGAEMASQIVDIDKTEGRTSVFQPVPVSTEFINTRLGFKLKAEDMATLLRNVEFDVSVSEDNATITVTAPFWRTDIETREDVVEEVGRLYGFDKLPLELPRRSIKPATKDPVFELKSNVRAVLAKAGASEVLTYSFVHGDLLRRTGQNPDEAFQVGNALSPDLQFYRLSLTPSLLDKVHMNIKAGYDEFALFEIGKSHGKSQLDEDGLPREYERLAFVYAMSDKRAAEQVGAPYYEARHYLETLLVACGVWQECALIPATQADWDGHAFYSEVVRPFDPTRSAVIYDGKRILGVVGEYTAATRRALKLPAHSAGFEFGLNLLSQHQQEHSYQALPRFPKVTQDMTLKVAADLPYDELFTLLQAELAKIQPEETRLSFQPLDIFQRTEDAAHKQVSFRLEIASYERTLQAAEVNLLLDTVANAAHGQLDAERV